MSDVIANDLHYPQAATIIKINLIEIKQVNPSDVILVVRQDAQELLIPLCLYKAEMIFMNDRYCWNTKEKEEFKLSLNKWSITIEGEAEEFSIDFIIQQIKRDLILCLIKITIVFSDKEYIPTLTEVTKTTHCFYR